VALGAGPHQPDQCTIASDRVHSSVGNNWGVSQPWMRGNVVELLSRVQPGFGSFSDRRRFSNLGGDLRPIHSVSSPRR
jgi:hypothetical protein